MAKSRPAPSALDQVRALLTAAEQKVLNSSMGATIAKATREQVEAAMKRARGLRDKWRDLHSTQARSTKRTPKAGSPVNERTKAKHDVFDGAVKRLEARLAELTAGVKAVVGGQAARLSATKKKPTKAARTKAAREGRAGVRSELKSAVAEMNTVAKKAAPSKLSAKRIAAAAVAPKPAPVAVTREAAGKKRNKKRNKPVAPLAAVAQRGLAFDAAKQRSAKAKSTVARLKFDGATTRRAGNALASTKRAQARRDGRRR
jgi:hypothetical protein